jgi:hypothetical protein
MARDARLDDLDWRIRNAEGPDQDEEPDEDPEEEPDEVEDE